MSAFAFSKISQRIKFFVGDTSRSKFPNVSFGLIAVFIGGNALLLSSLTFAQTQLVSANCSTNQVQNVAYFSSPPPNVDKKVSIPMNVASMPLNPVNLPMAPYWDFRYVNSVSASPLSQYGNHLPYSGINSTTSSQSPAWGTAASVVDPSGSLVQYKCINGYLAVSAMVNGWDTITPWPAVFGGPAASWTYQFLGADGTTGQNTAATPWNSDGSGNLMLQGLFIRPFYYSAVGIPGAEVNFNVFLSNKDALSKTINFVISVYRSNGDLTEDSVIGTDFTTHSFYVSTLVKDGTQYVTRSPYSNLATTMTGNTLTTESWPYFYRVNITYANLRNVLTKIPGNSNGEIYGLNPADWKVTNIAVQTEITGSRYQSVGSSVRAFEVYSSSGAM